MGTVESLTTNETQTIAKWEADLETAKAELKKAENKKKAFDEKIAAMTSYPPKEEEDRLRAEGETLSNNINYWSSRVMDLSQRIFDLKYMGKSPTFSDTSYDPTAGVTGGQIWKEKEKEKKKKMIVIILVIVIIYFAVQKPKKESPPPQQYIYYPT